MAKYAYKDAERKDVVYAVNALTEDRDKVFFCPNPNCTAHLYMCAVDGSRNAYFRATKSKFQHVQNCPFESNNNFNVALFDETEFVFDNAINSLCVVTATQKARKMPEKHSAGEVEKHPLRTLRQIYSMCKSYPVTDTYGDKEISEMILDDRSSYRYTRGCFGYKIIEAVTKRKFYDNTKKQIYLTAPIDSKNYSFILQFLDDNTYRVIRDEIYNNQNKIVVVAGKWEASGKYNYFTSEVKGRKQVAVIKK